MKNKNNHKLPGTLSQYLRLKAKEHKMSGNQLSKLILPGSSGSLIASVTFAQSKLSEKKIKKIADFFHEDHLILTFMAGRIPKKVYDLVIRNKDIQFLLLDMLKKTK